MPEAKKPNGNGDDVVCLEPPAAEPAPDRKPDRARRLLKYCKALGKTLKDKVGEGEAPYVFVCNSSSSSLEAIDFDTFPGLLSCHLIQEENRRNHVYSYWASRRIFRNHREAFLATLPDSAEIQVGDITQTKVKPRSLTERFPVWTVIITVSTVLGAVAALWDDGARFVEAPDITVAFKRDNAHNFGSSDVPTVSFSVTNQSRFTPASVRILSAINRVDDSSPPKTENARLSRIEPGKSSDFDSEGSVLSPVPSPGRAEEYQLRMIVIAKAGLLRAEQQFSFTSPTFKQWQSVGWTKPEKLRVSANSCYLRGTLYSGRAQKVNASISVGAPIGVDSVTTSLLGQNYIASDASDSGQVRTQVFVTGDLPAFSEFPYTVRVNSRGMSDNACDAIAQTLAQSNNVTFR